MNTKKTTYDKTAILNAMRTWIAQRPGLEFANYGDVRTYRAELRSIQRDKADAETLIRACELASGLTYETMIDAFRAYSGRLAWKDGKLDYCCGQYWPTEYRKAVCAVCAQALWDYYRDDADVNTTNRPGDALRAKFKRLFGSRMQSRWFV